MNGGSLILNRAGELIYGKSRDELLGKKITEVFSDNDTALLHFDEVMREKRPITFEIISEAIGDKWLELRSISYRNRSGVLFHRYYNPQEKLKKPYVNPKRNSPKYFMEDRL